MLTEACILHKTLWIVSGGIEAVPGIRLAKELGHYVVVSDGNPNAPGFQYADEAIVVSTYDIVGTVEEAIQYQRERRTIDGVICIAADVPLTVANVARELHLPGILVKTAEIASDKIAMKDKFVEMRIPVPWYSPLESLEHLRAIVRDRKGQIVIKPVDSRGARGVLRIGESTPNLEWIYDFSLQFSQSKRLMVEEYLEGPQISTESILLDGIGYTPGFVDRNYEYLERFAPNIIENGGQQPSHLSAEEKHSVACLAEEAGRALGVTNGVVKGDMVLTKDGPKVIEIATRLSGGWFSTDQIPLATGVDFIGCAICLALGEKIDQSELVPRFQKGVAIRYFFPIPGVVKKIKNIEKYYKTPWVHKLHFFVKENDVVEATTNHTKRAGFVITVGETRDEAVARAETVIQDVMVETV
jgi:biotin carboxylase